MLFVSAETSCFIIRGRDLHSSLWQAHWPSRVAIGELQDGEQGLQTALAHLNGAVPLSLVVGDNPNAVEPLDFQLGIVQVSTNRPGPGRLEQGER